MTEPSGKFNTSRQYIATRLFIPAHPRQGLWTTLNISVLPDYLAYIKKQLTKDEVLSLSEYHLQTYLLEAALKPEPDENFDQCTQKIIDHIRQNKQFWVKKTGQSEENEKKHFAISEYKKDMGDLIKLTEQMNYPQVPFRLSTSQKIIPDYIYIKNALPKQNHKFSASLFTSIIDFSMDQDQPEQLIVKIPFDFLQEIVLHFASKAKIRVRSNYHITEQEEILNNIGDQLINKFTNWLNSKDISDRALFSSKQCNFAFNMISILVKIIAKYPQSSETEQIIDQTKNLEQLKSDTYNRAFSENQIGLLVQWLLKNQKRIIEIRRARERQELKSKNPMAGFLHTPEELDSIKQKYDQLMKHPANINLTKYKTEGEDVPWTDQEYMKFLAKFLEFFNVPTNNKKIAMMMGKNVEPNHVKHVKGIYMRNMNARIENGEIGGGKKGVFQSKIDFLKKDLESFSMRYFKKETRIRSKHAKKRRKKLSLQDEDDSDY